MVKVGLWEANSSLLHESQMYYMAIHYLDPHTLTLCPLPPALGLYIGDGRKL